MTDNHTERKPLLTRLQNIDRRILYLILAIVVAIPTVRPVTVPNVPMTMSRSLWETIDSTPPNKIVLVSSTWSKGTRGENGGQAHALFEHMMNRHIKFALMSMTAPGAQVALDMVQSMAATHHYEYGKDWINLGFQASPNNFIKGINADFVGTVKKDALLKQPIGSFPVMQTVRSIDDVHIVVEISAAATHMYWIQLIKSGVNVGFCPTSVMAPESLPYYSAGQLCGVLWGAKGAYDYEQLNVEHHTGQYGLGLKYFTPLSAAFALVILSIAVGNIAMFMEKSRKAKGE